MFTKRTDRAMNPQPGNGLGSMRFEAAENVTTRGWLAKGRLGGDSNDGGRLKIEALL